MHARRTVSKPVPMSPYMALMVSGLAVGLVFGPFGAVIAMLACYFLTNKE